MFVTCSGDRWPTLDCAKSVRVKGKSRSSLALATMSGPIVLEYTNTNGFVTIRMNASPYGKNKIFVLNGWNFVKFILGGSVTYFVSWKVVRLDYVSLYIFSIKNHHLQHQGWFIMQKNFMTWHHTKTTLELISYNYFPCWSNWRNYFLFFICPTFQCCIDLSQ